MPYKLVGRTTFRKGKRLWEIVGNLKNFGEGRMVVRSTFERHYTEPTFYRIVVAKPEMNSGPPNTDEDNTKGRVLVEKVFRGRHDGVVDLSKAACKPDFMLVHKHEEHKYIEAFQNCKLPDIKIFSPVIEMPPLLKMVAERDGHAKKELQLVMNKGLKLCRIAKEGEAPTHWVNGGLGTPASPELYEGVL